jgi:hypothetical protein
VASKSKDQWAAEAAELGINVDELGADGEEPTIPQIKAAIDAVTAEVDLSADMFLAHHPQHRVPFAGLLVAEPHLREAELTESQWHGELKKYLKSERS